MAMLPNILESAVNLGSDLWGLSLKPMRVFFGLKERDHTFEVYAKPNIYSSTDFSLNRRPPTCTSKLAWR